jgi:hypothetical protein
VLQRVVHSFDTEHRVVSDALPVKLQVIGMNASLMCQYRIRGRCLAGQRQGLQQDKPFRLYGYDFTAGEKPTFLKACFGLSKSWHRSLKHFA